MYYSLPQPEEKFTQGWALAHAVPVVDTIRQWWAEPDKFKVKKDQEYLVASLRKVYKLVAAMLCRLYGRPDATTFNGTWDTIMEHVMMHDTHFNWANILMTSMHTNLSSALAPEEGLPSEFYMASYLLDVVCAQLHFEGWAHNWDPTRTSENHLQTKVFWDSRYKQNINPIS